MSAWVVKRFRDYGFAVLTGFYVVYLAASQVLASRIVVFDLGFYKFFAPSAVFIYPFIAQVIDMINETYGRRHAQGAILIALLTQILLVVFILMTNTLKPAPFFQYEAAWRDIFSLSVRITLASWISFYICQNLDAYVFSYLKKRFENIPLIRSLASDVIDLTVDSAIFVFLAFYGRIPVLPIILGQIVSKNIIGILDTPWFLWYRRLIS
ncbi:VUT family protein [bacterium]|nr:MAG: VUT family protein [bacterium]